MRNSFIRIAGLLFGCEFLLASLAGQTAVSNTSAPDVQREQLEKHAIAEDWPSYNGDYTGRRFSSLTQITP